MQQQCKIANALWGKMDVIFVLVTEIGLIERLGIDDYFNVNLINEGIVDLLLLQFIENIWKILAKFFFKKNILKKKENLKNIRPNTRKLSPINIFFISGTIKKLVCTVHQFLM